MSFEKLNLVTHAPDSVFGVVFGGVLGRFGTFCPKFHFVQRCAEGPQGGLRRSKLAHFGPKMTHFDRQNDHFLAHFGPKIGSFEGKMGGFGGV